MIAKLRICVFSFIGLYIFGCWIYSDLAGVRFDVRSLAMSWPWALATSPRLTWPFFIVWAGLIILTGVVIYEVVVDRRKLFGEARFARTSEMKRAGLLGDQGVIVGQVGRHRGSRLLMAPGWAPVALAAPPRSGKGQGVVLPNCLNWPGSLVNLDVKRENYELTAGYRQSRGQSIYFWNPAAADGRTHAHNFLAYVDTASPSCINEVQQLSYWLLGSSADEKSKFWESNSRQLFQAVCLLVLFTAPPEERHLGTVQRYVMHPNGLAWLRDRLEESVQRNMPVPHTATELILRFMKLPDETREGIVGQYQSATELLNNPVTLASISGHDFDLRDLKKRPMTIYVSMTPEDRDRLRPLLSLFFQQLLVTNTREIPSGPQAESGLLLLLDEMASLGRIDVLKNGISYLPGYNIRLVSILQTPAQLRDPALYGREGADVILQNHSWRVIFRPAPVEGLRDAEEISKAMGTDTTRRKSKSFNKGAVSTSVSDHGRPLMLPQEIASLDERRILFFTPNTRPVLAYKVIAHKDAEMRRRMDIAAPEIPAQAISKWASVDFTRAALEGTRSSPNAASTDAVADASTEAHEGIEPLFAPGEVNAMFANLPEQITDEEAEQVAEQLLGRLGVSFSE